MSKLKVVETRLRSGQRHTGRLPIPFFGGFDLGFSLFQRHGERRRCMFGDGHDYFRLTYQRSGVVVKTQPQLKLAHQCC